MRLYYICDFRINISMRCQQLSYYIRQKIPKRKTFNHSNPQKSGPILLMRYTNCIQWYGWIQTSPFQASGGSGLITYSTKEARQGFPYHWGFHSHGGTPKYPQMDGVFHGKFMEVPWKWMIWGYPKISGNLLVMFCWLVFPQKSRWDNPRRW